MTLYKIGDSVLIKSKGHFGKVAYIFWQAQFGASFCQMEPPEGNNPFNFKPKYIVVPDFDHCGSPRPLELWEDEIIRLP